MSAAVLCVLAGLWLAARPVAGQGYPRDERQREWNQPFDPLTIIGNVHYVGTVELASYLVTTPQGHVLIDSGLEDSGAQVLAAIRRLGFQPADVRILLNTQAHYDHAAGLAAIKQATGARMYASAADAPILASGGHDDFAFGDDLAFAPVAVDRVVADGGTVSVGSAVLTAHLTPGHTKGTTTWTMTVRDGGRDYRVVFAGSTTINPGVVVRNNPKYPGMFADFERTFRTLRALPVDVFLSQHAGAFGLAAKAERLRAGASPNPFIDPDGYARWVDAGEAAFRKRAN